MVSEQRHLLSMYIYLIELVKQVLLASPILALNQELGPTEHYMYIQLWNISYISSYVALVAWTVDWCR